MAGFQRPYLARYGILLLGTSTEEAKAMTVELLIGVIIGFVSANLLPFRYVRPFRTRLYPARRLITGGDFLKVVGSVVAVALVGLSIFHWSNGASVGWALRQTINDVRVGVTCPERIVDFIGRSYLESLEIGLESQLGETSTDWIGKWCEGEIT